MTVSKPEFKYQGLEELKLYLLGDQGHATRAELARRFGVHRGTITRWVESLESIGYVVDEDEHRRLFIDRRRYPTHLQLSRQESVVVMLALRLLQQYQDKPNALAVQVLQKLGVTLQQGVAPAVGQHILSMADQQRRAFLDQRSDVQRTLERLGDAWIEQRKIHLWYRPFRAKRAFEEWFHPYLLEPSAIGRSTYVIGYSELAGDIRTRKVERIEQAIVQDDTFIVGDTFDAQQLLSGAWGIWFNQDDEPTTVKLRFSAQVARRVTESRWHPSEHVEPDGAGGLIWTAQIDEEQEILWWVRSWGPACEVLEPQHLRETLIGETRQIMRQYGLHETDAADRHQRFSDIFD
jgi:CRISPR-associated endonuclease/helicase Cas3